MQESTLSLRRFHCQLRAVL